MRVLLFFFNILASIGLLLLVGAGFFYGAALFCVPFYATYRAFTEKDPSTKRRYTTTAIASAVFFFLVAILALMLSKGAEQAKERERQRQQKTTYTTYIVPSPFA
ncbi:preprotein translocase subunit SecG [Capnocytophaga granulosa]|uniref:preprotein translocase subunit SecG n=1 Tax=Capnocytophaga granulosa TaxID=45242 RepID=UPI003619B7CD